MRKCRPGWAGPCRWSRPRPPTRIGRGWPIWWRGATIRAEKNRAGTAQGGWIAREMVRLLKQLQAHLACVAARIAKAIAARAREDARLRSVPGIGPTLSAVLPARLPELGQLGHRQIADLAGLAPHACASGVRRGRRQIRGGRAEVRRARSLAAFVASRHDPVLKACRARLQDAGKPAKPALTACARKLLTPLNAMVRNSQDYRKQTG